MKRFVVILALVFAVLLMGSKGIIAAERTFKAIASPFPPFTCPDLENNGVAWEICKTAFETQGYTVTLRFAPWARAMEESKHGRYDGLLPAYWTEERTQWFLYPMPLVTIHTGFIKRKSRKEIIFRLFQGETNTTKPGRFQYHFQSSY